MSQIVLLGLCDTSHNTSRLMGPPNSDTIARLHSLAKPPDSLPHVLRRCTRERRSEEQVLGRLTVLGREP